MELPATSTNTVAVQGRSSATSVVLPTLAAITGFAAICVRLYLLESRMDTFEERLNDQDLFQFRPIERPAPTRGSPAAPTPVDRPSEPVPPPPPPPQETVVGCETDGSSDQN